ncbi:MAG: DUF4932 domain-containing protein [Planctomycetota bacterium]|jgi:hypothetical protein
MNKDTTNDNIEGMQVAIKNVAFCTAILLVFSIGMFSPVLAANNPPVVYRANVGKITIEVDPRVELIGIVFRLAGNPEFNDGTLKPYAKAIEKHFGDFDGHPVVKMAAKLRNKRLMSCDGPMSLAVHIDDNYRLRKTAEEWPSTLDYRWEREETAEFLEKLRQFAAETEFDKFFKAQSSNYEQGIRPCKSVLEQNEVAKDQSGLELVKFLSVDVEEWLSDFFGIENTGDLRLVLGFVNGFCNYGVQFTTDRVSEKYAIIGMRPFDPANTIIFHPQQIETVAHEFCHSFANPVVEKYMDRLQPTGERLFATHGASMRMGGYQKWESVMYETAVRACVASFIRDSIVAPGFADYCMKKEVRNGFVWTEDLDNLLKTYQSNRDKYPTFESFFPEFVAFFNEYTKKPAR